MAIAPLVGEGESQRKNKNKQKNCYQTDEDFLCLHSIWEQIREGRNMKRTAQIAVIGALLAVGIAQSYAQSNAVVVSQLNVALSGFSGGSDTATPVRLSNKDIISALNASSGGFSFGKTAKL